METLIAPNKTRQIKKGIDYGLKKGAKLAESLEKSAERIPPAVYMGFGLDCCIASSFCALTGHRRLAYMFGTWSLFSMMVGIYTKLDRHIAESEH